MSIVWSLVWGLLVFATMLVTIKYYLPCLTERTQTSASEALAYSCSSDNEQDQIVPESNGRYNSAILNHHIYTIVMLVSCVSFSVWCGYIASVHSVTAVSMVKMTLAMAVLSSTFITDMELMTIPNLCSVIMVVGRVATIIYEFICIKDDAGTWLLNSVIAMIMSLIVLLIMTKVTQGGLGMGDVKLFSSLGFLCGVRAVCFTLMFAFILCALISTILLVTKKKKLKDSLPMGPFIWMGYGVTVLLSVM